MPVWEIEVIREKAVSLSFSLPKFYIDWPGIESKPVW